MWAEAFPNRSLGAATIDHLWHGAYEILLEGKSYRSTQPTPKAQDAASENPEMTIEIRPRKEVKTLV